MIRLSIKGNREESEKAILDHGIEGAEYLSTNTNRDGLFAASYWNVPEFYRSIIVEWFCLPAKCGETGFPIGTLLHHT